LTRLGHYEYLYIAMSAGIALIFLGVLATRRPESASGPKVIRPAQSRMSTLATTSQNDASPSAALAIQETNALGFVGQHILALDDATLDRFCTEWSVPRDESPVFARDEARRAWAFRLALSDEARTRFDTHTVPARRQIVVLFDEVLAPAEGAEPGISVVR
jgi:hypothetical protein